MLNKIGNVRIRVSIVVTEKQQLLPFVLLLTYMKLSKM